jgi:site-specific DNA-cytosine methylase
LFLLWHWIQTVTPVRQLFGCVFDLVRDSAHNFISGSSEKALAALFWLCGFSCRTASTMNTRGESASTVVSDFTGQTGYTLWAVLLYLQTVAPPTFLLENVCGLIRCGLASKYYNKLCRARVLKRLRRSSRSERSSRRGPVLRH